MQLIESLFSYKPDITIVQLLTPAKGEPEGLVVVPFADRDGLVLRVTLEQRKVCVKWRIIPPADGVIASVDLVVHIMNDAELGLAYTALSILKKRQTS